MAVIPGRAALFFFSSRRRHTRCLSDGSSDVCSSDLSRRARAVRPGRRPGRDLRRSGVRTFRSEERRVGKSVDLGGRRIIKKKNKKTRRIAGSARNTNTRANEDERPMATRRSRWEKGSILQIFFFFKQKTAYEMPKCLEFRRVLFRSESVGGGRHGNHHAATHGRAGTHRGADG